MMSGSDIQEQVDHPKHYEHTPVETIDIIRGAMSPDQFQAYCQGNVLKYVTRYRYKGMARKDLLKGKWYLNKLLEEVDE